MSKTGKTTKKITYIGIFVALALILSYVEALIPFNFGIPGVKLGLANLVVVCALYMTDAKSAFVVGMLRIVLSSLLFSPGIMVLYSLAGGMLSFLAMYLFRRLTKLSIVGVSIIGGVFHNIGQLAVAALILETFKIAYYLPVLMISGLITGMLIGICASYMLKLLPDKFFN